MSLLGLVVAAYVAALLIRALFGVSPNALPDPHRKILVRLFDGRALDQPPVGGRGGLAIGVLFLGLIGLVGLSIPLQFFANPAYAAYGVNGRLPGLVCLVLFGLWVVYLVIVFGRASRAPVARPQTEYPRPAAPATAAKLAIGSALGPQECAEAIRGQLRAAVQRNGGGSQVRDCEVLEATDGSLMVTFLQWSSRLPVENQRPTRVRTWLTIDALGSGSTIRVALATRTALGFAMTRWVLPAAALACFATALLVPYVATPFVFVGAVVTMVYVAVVVAAQLFRPAFVRECRICVGLLCHVVQGVATPEGRKTRSIPLAAWNDVRADQIA
jgi:hypothetical protein